MKKELEYIKNKKYFNFIKGDKKLKSTLEEFSAYILHLYSLLQGECENELVKFYEHSIKIYMGSVVEAIVYYFAKEKLANKEKYRRKYLEIEEFRKYQDIKNTNLVICEKIKKEMTLNDSINFKALIDGLRDKKLMPEEIIEKINNFRKARNSVHINVYKSGEEIFENLIRFFNDFKDIRLFIENNL